jgi:PAS domain S-box-containing protein
MPRLLPRTIRGQLIASIVLYQLALVLVFITVLFRGQREEMEAGRVRALASQTRIFTGLISRGLESGDLPTVYSILNELRVATTIRSLRITDMNGGLIAYEDHSGNKTAPPLSDAERSALPSLQTHQDLLTINDGGELVGAYPVQLHGKAQAIGWLTRNDAGDIAQLHSYLMLALVYSAFTLFGNLAIAMLLTRLISRPVQSLLAGTRALTLDSETASTFPLPIQESNELGDLTKAFNGMVASLREQRAGLSETLALLDSLLANAPIGFAFFDRDDRYVRINQFLADINGVPLEQHIGHRITEILSSEMSATVRATLQRVFVTGEAVRDVEIHGVMPSTPRAERSWLVSFYPIRTADQHVRWVGAVVVEITERRQSEALLRRTEKLAAAGQLAASIAHEINNPLESVTNLLYLLRNHPGLDAEAIHYADLAQSELARVAQLTQQTLRFYRQSTSPTKVNLAELMDSVLLLYHGRTSAARIEIELKYSAKTRILCFAGEMRQLFANLIANALDAMPDGGRLKISVRDSTSGTDDTMKGIRVTVADTGTGMSPETRRHIFEPFFTTKEATGTGLGLWVSAEIIAKHSGIVRVHSRTGHHCGTVFMIFFPQDGLRDGADRGLVDQQTAETVDS